jgi:hypothetical protein
MDVYGGPDYNELPSPPQDRLIPEGIPDEFPHPLKLFACIMIAVVLFALLTGCATPSKDTSAAVFSFKATWCATNDPIRPTAEELAAKSETQKRQDLEHNLKGADWCGWKP